jgi:phosphonate metabolism-associated iron-containing alcohol dehydrogenase
VPASHWKFWNPVRILFGLNRLGDLPSLVVEDRVLLLTTQGCSRRGLTAAITDLLPDKTLSIRDHLAPNPEIDSIQHLTASLDDERVDVIVALGGGSVMDTAKALSVSLPGKLEGFSLRAHFATGTPLPSCAPLKVIAIPTTAGTGSEVTPFATIWDTKAGEKYSLNSERLFPHTALLDPILTATLPRRQTIISGLDALSHAFESLWNRNASPLTAVWARHAIDLTFKALPRLLATPEDLVWRARMLEASLLGGLAISQTKTALAHSISYHLTARRGVPHGLACSFTLPALLEFNRLADDGSLLALSQQLGCASAAALGERLDRLYRQLGVSQLLQDYRLGLEDLLKLRPFMLKPGRADNNWRPADLEDLEEILAQSMKILIAEP